jgi:molybdopterin synthase catalytic subunit
MSAQSAANSFLLSPELLDATAAAAILRDPECGAEVIFHGVVRNTSAEREVIYLDFEAYESMVLSEFGRMAQRAREMWPVDRIVMHHRTGRVYPGEMAVIAAVSARHRKAAFETCAWLMDELKRTVPIWKKEVFADGEEWVSPTP